MKPFLSLAIAVFSIAAILQFVRLALGWAITVEGFAIPLWASGVAGTVAGGLAFMLWREAQR